MLDKIFVIMPTYYYSKFDGVFLQIFRYAFINIYLAHLD